MSRPSNYNLGTTPEISLEARDVDGILFVPTEARLSIERPDGETITVSGADFSTPYSSHLYSPPTAGWYEYEVWIKDAQGREAAKSSGFHVTDRVQ